jgi:hypothetical protein
MIQPKIEIKGLSEFNRFLSTTIPDEVRPSIIRGIARKPALKAVHEARRLQPVGDTGQMARTIGILRVANPRQTWVEVGYKGRSKGHIFTTPKKQLEYVRHTKKKDKWKIKTFMWLFERAGQNISDVARNDIRTDITNIMVRAFRRKGYAR